ncbi:MAG: glutamate--tRNA ligase [bacterium]
MVRTRIAPSPTGEDLHIGSIHTALINWVYARKNEGQFIVRIEDTDRERFVKGAEEKILNTLKRYGLEYDEGPDKEGAGGPYRQSERLETYEIYANELLEKGFAYYCICTKERIDKLRKQQIKEKKVPKYDKSCLKNQEDIKKKVDNGADYVIRLNIKHGTKIEFEDLIRGKISFESKNIDDQILIKSDGFPTYHLAVVVDDHLMKVTHVIRGEEWISSTPKHILLYEAFEWEKPIFAHTPLLRDKNKTKLSKRNNPIWASWYLDQGYLPKAILNYLALMGWSHPKQKEVFNMDEFIKVFDLKDIRPVGPAFDPVKLEWLNGEHIRLLDDDLLADRISNFIGEDYNKDLVLKTIPLIKERIKKLSEYIPLCEFFFKEPEKYEIDLKSHKIIIKEMHKELSKLEDWKANKIGEIMLALANREKIRITDFFMTLRVAITGKKITPPLNESMELLGKKECLKRLKI